MTELFDMYERLYRAVYPPNIMPLFWKEDGQLSSAAFKDKKGLSVERDGGRDEKTVIDTMRLFFYGSIIYLIVRDCEMCNAVVKYLPSQRSVFHSEIHGSTDRRLLSQSQCKCLAQRATIIG